MKHLKLFPIFVLLLFFAACTSDDEEETQHAQGACETTADCPISWHCDPDKKLCVNDNSGGSDTSDSGNDPDDHGNSGDSSESGNSETGSEEKCTPGEVQKCGYPGDPKTENVGPCKAGTKTCNENGKWGYCEGEILPVAETGDLCSDGVDNDCNGIVDDGCETDIDYDCDSSIQASSTDPVDYAKAIGICKTTTEGSSDWGLISAKITAPNGSPIVHPGSNALLSALGARIVPQHGNLMLGLGTGIVGNPFESIEGSTTSGAPEDWLELNGGEFPSATSCKGNSGTKGSVNDAVMLEMKIKVPNFAKSFSFNIYFLTEEYPDWICKTFNDFFVALLDSDFESDSEAFRNPADKNLAMDSIGNPVGVNLAPAGLFTQCKNITNNSAYEVTSCVGTEDLEGTGFIKKGQLGVPDKPHGGTGWLTTRGNVIPGEVITLRLAIWDLNDHKLDSLVLIDNFKWSSYEQAPGTDDQI